MINVLLINEFHEIFPPFIQEKKGGGFLCVLNSCAFLAALYAVI
jgi:hypothetical protein